MHSGLRVGGRYELTRLIASGGMAEVWEAVDTVLERRVAVKILHGHLAADGSFVARFRTEAVAAARLHHPSIVSIFDTCSDDGIEAIVMELVQGHTLRQALDEAGALEPARVIDIAAEVADALQAAHRAGLVHRDIKPANILLCDDSRVMVTDFGIAKVRDDADHTQTGTMLGSVKYLAPEQVEGGPLDGRADIYALGIVCYEALTGQAPFVADTQAATALARLHTTPPRPRQLQPTVPPVLDDVVMRAIARYPDDRYATAADLRAALLAARPGSARAAAAPIRDPDLTPVIAPPVAVAVAPSPAPARPTGPVDLPPPRRRRALWPGFVALLVVGALAVAGVLVYRTTTGQKVLDAAANSGLPVPGVRTEPLPIVEAVPFDPPPGDGAEPGGTGAADATKVFDGNPATGWKTEQYDTRKMGNLKPGVGIYVKLEKPSTVRTVKVTSPTQGWAAQVYVAAKPGATLAEWGDPVATKTDIAGSAEFDTGATEGQYVLVWITDLGSGPPRVLTEIDEITVLGS